MLVALQDATTTTAAAATDATATGEATAATAGMGTELLGMVIPLVLMFAVFYFLLIRPQRKKDKKVKDMLSNLKVGDRICTIGAQSAVTEDQEKTHRFAGVRNVG